MKLSRLVALILIIVVVIILGNIEQPHIAQSAQPTCDFNIAAGDVAGLIAAIDSANVNGLPDTICLTDSTYAFTTPHDAAGNALPVILSEITIIGNNARFERVGATPLRFFELTGNGILTLSNMTLANGRAGRTFEERTGGAIFSRGQLTARDTTFENNSVEESGGGAISSLGTVSVVFLERSTFINNQSDSAGGAVALLGPTPSLIVDSIFDSNTTVRRSATSGAGGAIFASGPVTVRNSVFMGNTASRGGAIEGRDIFTIEASTFDSNEAQVTNGGAVFIEGGDATISDSIFIDNNATDSGGALGVDHDPAGLGGDVNISQSCFLGNSGPILSSEFPANHPAENNWWGASDGPRSTTNHALSQFDIDPFLTTPPFPECLISPPADFTQSVQTLFETPVQITLESYGGLQPFTFSNISTPANGTLSGTAPDLTYTPDMGFVGIDSFTFTFTDSQALFATGTVEIDVQTDLQATDISEFMVVGDTIPVTLTATGGTPPYTFQITEDVVDPLPLGVLSGTPPNLTYTSDGTCCGVDRYLFEVTDANGFTNIAGLDIQVDAVPSVEDVHLYASSGTARTFLVSVTGGRAPLSFAISDPQFGTLTGGGPQWTYTPNENFDGLETLAVTVTDANGATGNGSVFISSATPLSAVSSIIDVPFETAVNFQLEAFGGVPPYTFSITQQPIHGTMTEMMPTVTYTPNMGVSLLDSFVFEVTDSQGFSDLGSIQLNIKPEFIVDDANIVTNFEQSVEFTLSVFGGFTPYSFAPSTPQFGTLTGDGPTFTYTPLAGFSGQDIFTIDVFDTIGSSRPATVTVTVSTPFNIVAGDTAGLIAAINAANANTAPDTIILENGTYPLTAINNTSSNGNNGLPVITTEIVIRGNDSTITRASVEQFRLFEVDATGKLTLQDMTLSNGLLTSSLVRGSAVRNGGEFHGDNLIVENNTSHSGAFADFASMTLTNSQIINNNANISAAAIYSVGTTTITNTIIAGNRTENPVGGNGQGGAFFVGAPGSVNVSDSIIANNFAGTSGGAFYGAGVVTVTNSCIIGNSHISVHRINGTYNFANNWWGAGVNPSRDVDPLLLTDSVNALVGTFPFLTTSPPNCPMVAGQEVRTAFEQPIAITLNDPTNGTPPYTSEIGLSPANGVLGGTPPNVTYTPNAGFSGEDVFTVVATDNTGLKAVNIITVTVAEQFIANDLILSMTPGTTLDFALGASGGTEPFVFNILSSPTNGSLSGTAPNITYTPNNSFEGVDSFTYEVTDALAQTSTATVTINVLPLTPNNLVLNVEHNTHLEIPLNIVGGLPPYTLSNITPPSNGDSAGAELMLLYVPHFGFSGTDSFTYDITDADGATVTSTVTLNVAAQPPATIIVDTTVEENPTVVNGNCTLLEAYTAAVANIAVDNCNAGRSDITDIIQVPAGTFDLTGTLASDHLLTINDSVIIRGAGIDATIINRPVGTDNKGAFNVRPSAHLTLQGLTIQNWGDQTGSSVRRGGAVFNAGTLTTFEVRFLNNDAFVEGGAIYNEDNSVYHAVTTVFEQNSAVFEGGVIESNLGAELTILNSFFNDNNLPFPSSASADMTIFGSAEIHFNCFGTTGANLVVEARTGSVVNLSHNWWGVPGISQDGGGPGLNAAPAICDRFGIPQLQVAPGDVQGLIDAINLANTRSNADIHLAAGSTYFLTDIFNPFIGVNQETMLPGIRTQMTIHGHGATLTKDPAVQGRILAVDGGDLTLLDVTISNGLQVEGAGIRVFNGILELQGSLLTNNVTLSDIGTSGAAIDATNSQLRIFTSRFENNTTQALGAGIAQFEGSLVADQNLFVNNTAAAGSGIAIIRGSNVEISNNCFIANNGTSVETDAANNGGTIIDATNNWWNAIDGPSGAGTGSGEPVGDRIIFDPFLTAPPGCPSLPLIAFDQTIDMTVIETQAAITLTASGGIAPYTFAIVTPPTNGVLSGAGADVIYTPNVGFIGADTFTFSATDTNAAVATATITINVNSSNIIVDTTAQEFPFINNGNCTLGEAIQAANTDTAVDNCPAGDGDDIIELAAGATYTLNKVVDNTNGPNGLPNITSGIIIIGNNATVMRSDVAGTPQMRMFHVDSTGSLWLNDMQLNNGVVDSTNINTDRGGAINSIGELRLSNVAFTNNRAFFVGGAVAHAANTNQSFIVEGGSFTNNVAGSGGGIWVCAPSTITDTILTNNSATAGGGIYNRCDPMTMRNVTLIGNHADTDGGGLFIRDRNTHVIDSIFVDNVANRGASVFSNPLNTTPNTMPIVEHSCLIDSATSGVEAPRHLQATNNWWGSETGPSGEGNGIGTSVVGFNVTFEPFLTAPILGCGILPPTAVEDTVHTAFETPVAITLSAVDGVQPYNFAVTVAPANGSLSGTAPNITYTPNAGFVGTDTFTFEVTDNNAATSTAIITVEVAPQLVAPDRVVDVYFETGTAFNFSASGGRAPYQFSIQGGPTNGLVSGPMSSPTYEPNIGFIGIDTMTYTVTDANGTTDTGMIDFNVTGPVVALDGAFITRENTAIVLSPTATDGSPDYIFLITTPPSHGGLFLIADNGTKPLYLYNPQTGFLGRDTFTFSVTDQNGDSDNGQVIIDVQTADGIPVTDLAVTQVDSADPIMEGAVVDYTITVDNIGALAANNIIVENQLPTNTTLNAPVAGAGTCGELNGVITCDLGTLDSGGTATLTVSVLTSQPGTLMNQVTVSSFEHDVDPTNNTSIEETIVERIPTPPDAPLLLTPADGATIFTQTPTLDWLDVVDAVLYEVEVDNTATFDAPVQSNMPAGSSYDLMTPLPDGQYWWRVRAQDSEGDWSAWSTIRTLTIDTSMLGPNDDFDQAVSINPLPYRVEQDTTLASFALDDPFPDCGSGLTHSVWFHYNTTSDAIIQMSTEGSDYDTVLSVWTGTRGNLRQEACDDNSGLNGTSIIDLHTIAGLDYYIMIGGNNGSNGHLAFSAHELGALPVIDVPLSDPGDNLILTDPTPTFNWVVVNGAVDYLLQIATTVDFSTTVFTQVIPGAANTIITIPETDALPQGDYFWRVNVDTGAGFSASTIVHQFTITTPPLPPPVLTAAGNNGLINDPTPALSWQPVANAISYEVQIDDDRNFNSPNQTAIVTGTTYVADTLPDGVHYWRVRSRNLLETVGAWSAASQFTLDTSPPDVPVIALPNGGTVENNRAQLRWNKNKDAVMYEVRLDTVNPPVFTIEVRRNKYKPPSALLPTTYFWQVRAIDRAGNASAWSPVQTLNVISPERSSPILNRFTTLTPTLTWNPLSWATEYEIQIDISRKFNTSVAQTHSVAAPTTTLVTDTLADGVWLWRIRARDASGNWGKWSSPEMIVIDAP